MLFDIRLIALIITAVVNVLLAAFVYKNNPKSATSKIFGALSIVTTIWLVDVYLSVTPEFFGHALIWVRLSIFLAAPQVALFLLFASTAPGEKIHLSRSKLRVLLFLTLLMMADSLSPLAFTNIEVVGKAVEASPGPGLPFFGLFAITVSATAIYVLWSRSRHATAMLREQYLYMLVGILLMLGLLVGTVLIPVAVFKNSSFVPFVPLYTIIFLGATTYAIVKKRLFNIRAVVARSVTYVLLLVALASFYAIGVYGFSSIFFNNGGISQGQLIANVFLALILAFTFQPLRRFFEQLTDRIFYRDRYDTQIVLNDISKILASELLLDRLLDKTLAELCGSLRIQTGQLMIFEDNRIYKVAHFGPLPNKLMVAPTTLKLRQSMLVVDELEGGERKQIMEDHGVRVSMMLRTRDEFVGFLFLGDKLSGDIFSAQDIGLLEILSSELAVAITNAKAYERISQFNITLQDRVNQATARLRVANHNLKALDKAKDEFISMASHQLRTPLTTIKGYLSMIIEGDAGKVTPEQKEFLDYAFGGAERMVALISDLLNVSRLSAGRFVIEKAPADLSAVVADEVRQLGSHASAKQLELKYTPPKKKLPMVELDEGKTRQVIMNFIDNAIYYTKQGGVYVSLEADKDNVSLRVRDSGIGVPESAKKKLFTKFFRADNAQAARPDGTGLGLYLAKRVVEDQGGSLIFESKEGKGSTFGFVLPIKASKAKKAQPTGDPAAKPKVIDVKPIVKV